MLRSGDFFEVSKNAFDEIPVFPRCDVSERDLRKVIGPLVPWLEDKMFFLSTNIYVTDL